MVLAFKDYQSQLNEERNNTLGEYVGIDTVMGKIVAYQKRELACINSATNENYRHITKNNPNIYFSIEEKNAVKNLFKEFIPRVVESMVEEFEEEGIEIDESIFQELNISEELNEGWLKDHFPKTFAAISNGASKVANAVKGTIDKPEDYIEKKAEKIENADDEKKKSILERFKGIIAFLQELVSKGINSVKDFISKIVDLFEKLGESVKDALKKLGVFKQGKNEEDADVKYDDKLVEGMADDQGEKSFLSHVIAYVSVMMSKGKNVDTLLAEGLENVEFDFEGEVLNEGKLMDKIANNKFMQFILVYGKGKKFSIWKSIIISIVGSLVISLGLPVILPICGVGASAVATICAAVRIIWSGRSAVRIILNRYVNKKPDEKLFDAKTCFLLAIAIIPQIPPFKDWIAHAFEKLLHWLHIDQWINNLSEKIGNLVEKLHGQNPSLKTMEEAYEETVLRPGGGRINFGNYEQNNADFLAGTGAAGDELTSLETLVTCADGENLSSGMTNIVNKTLDNVGANLHHGITFDTTTAGQNAKFAEAVDSVMSKLGIENVTSGTIVGRTLHGATHRVAGAIGIVYNCDDAFIEAVKDEFTKMGGDLGTMHINTFGEGIAETVVSGVETVTTTTNWLLDSIIASFSPIFIPWFNKSYWGKYKMSFASGTRGSASYVVDKVETHSEQELKDLGANGSAFDAICKLHNDAWEDYKKFSEQGKEEVVEEGKDSEKKEDKDKKEKKVEEPGYITFFVRPNEDTGKDSDKIDKDEKNSEDDEVIGIIMDSLTLMCADICNFGEDKSGQIRRRKQPYFMKGLLSRLSFRPTKSKDNDTKDFIRTTLGKSMKTIVAQSVMYGAGRNYIDTKKDGKKAEFSLRETRRDDENAKINPEKTLFELGNFSPAELLQCLNDDSGSNKVCYDFLDGKFSSKVSIKIDDKGNVKKSVLHDESSIENVRYFKVSKAEYEDAMKTYDGKVKKWEADGKKGKKPSKPSFVKGENSEVYYKRASQKWIKYHKSRKVYDYVDIKIIPLLKKGDLYEQLVDDKSFKKLLYVNDEKDNVVLNKTVINILKPYLYRPEKTFSKTDENDLAKQIKEEGGVKRLGWGKDGFDIFKDMIEVIWDYLSENRRKVYKSFDKKENQGKSEEVKESYELVEYTVFDELLEDMFNDEYDEDTEYEYDKELIVESKPVISYEDYLKDID